MIPGSQILAFLFFGCLVRPFFSGLVKKKGLPGLSVFWFSASSISWSSEKSLVHWRLRLPLLVVVIKVSLHRQTLHQGFFHSIFRMLANHMPVTVGFWLGWIGGFGLVVHEHYKYHAKTAGRLVACYDFRSLEAVLPVRSLLADFEPSLGSAEDRTNSQLQLWSYLTACTFLFLVLNFYRCGCPFTYLVFRDVFLLFVCQLWCCPCGQFGPSQPKVNKVPEKYSLVASGMCRLGHLLHLKFACDIFLSHSAVRVCCVPSFFLSPKCSVAFFCQNVAGEMNAAGCLRDVEEGTSIGSSVFYAEFKVGWLP